MRKVLFTATVDSHILQFHLPFLKLFKENGYEVHVATNGNEEIPYCDVKHVVSFERSPIKINNLKAIRQLRKIINEEKFDIIHTHTPMGSVVTRLAAKKARKKYHTRVIYTAHGLHFFKGASAKNWLIFYPVEKYLSKYTDTLILINQEDYDLCKRKFKKCKDIQYVPGVGIDEAKFDFEMSEKEKHDLRKSVGVKDDDFVIIYPAEISKRKRQIWLIETINNLLKKNSNIHLLLPGKDSLEGKCQELVKELSLENQVHFLGYRKDIPKLLKISNLAISSANQEGLPVNIMEAMYVGLPIVASNCRGNRDLIQDNINGYLVSLEDNERFSKSIENMYNDTSKSGEFGNKSKEIINDYLLDKIMIEMKNIYFKQIKTLAIITSGFLPVPASKGGAAENLIDTIVIQNEKFRRIKPVIFSIYDEKAKKISEKYKCSEFVFIKLSFISLTIDRLNYFVIDKILKKKNSRKYRYILQRFEFLFKCSRALKKNDYDKVLLENHSIMYLALKWNKNYLKYKDNYYYHCHNVIPSRYGMDEIISDTKKVISVSEFRNNYIKNFFGMKDENCSVVLNCCSGDVLRHATKAEIDDLKNKYNLNDKKIILYIGRVDKDKGTLELVKACNKIDRNDFKLLVVGAPIFDTGITTDYEKLVKNEISKNDNFIMTGYVKHEELYKFYSLADVVVIPSQVEDSAPLVLIESISNGKPVIASNCGGIPEYVNKKCAILVNWGEQYIDDLAKAIEKVLYDNNLKLQMGIESKKQSNLYSEEIYYNQFLDNIVQ